MKLRLATEKDLSEIQSVYREITEYMKKQGIVIWDEIYPNDFFIFDIQKEEFFVLEEKGVIIGGFALNSEDKGAEFIKWEKDGAPSLYLNRLGVKTGFLRKGLGQMLLREAGMIAKEKGAHYIRLFVVDYNEPAIKLYEKCGYKKGRGIYEKFQGEITLREYGYEIKL